MCYLHLAPLTLSSFCLCLPLLSLLISFIPFFILPVPSFLPSSFLSLHSCPFILPLPSFLPSSFLSLHPSCPFIPVPSFLLILFPPFIPPLIFPNPSSLPSSFLTLHSSLHPSCLFILADPFPSLHPSLNLSYNLSSLPSSFLTLHPSLHLS